MTKPVKRGWFTIPGIQEGERTLAEGIVGLELIGHNLHGQTVLDLGCAEGLIGHWCLERGAKTVEGLDGSVSIVRTGQGLAKKLGEKRLSVSWWNLNSDTSFPLMLDQYDVVLALSIIHKLKDPERFLDLCKRLARRWLVIRAPVPDIKVQDRDSHDWYRLDIPRRVSALADEQFTLVEQTPKAKVPWVGTFKRLSTEEWARLR